MLITNEQMIVFVKNKQYCNLGNVHVNKIHVLNFRFIN